MTELYQHTGFTKAIFAFISWHCVMCALNSSLRVGYISKVAVATVRKGPFCLHNLLLPKHSNQFSMTHYALRSKLFHKVSELSLTPLTPLNPLTDRRSPLWRAPFQHFAGWLFRHKQSAAGGNKNKQMENAINSLGKGITNTNVFRGNSTVAKPV